MFDWWNVWGLIIGGACLGSFGEHVFGEGKSPTPWNWFYLIMGLINIGIALVYYTNLHGIKFY